MIEKTFQFTEWRNRGLMVRASLHFPKSEQTRGLPWIIFAHGFTGHRIGPNYLFVKIAESLSAAGICSLRFDFAGSGESEGRFSDMNISSMRSDLLSAVNYCRENFKPAFLGLLGHSLGGCIVALCARDAKTDGLILLAPVARPAGMLDRRKDTVLMAGPNKNGFYENGPHEMSLTFADDLRLYDPLLELEGFSRPMIIFQGDEDASISLAESGLYREWGRQAGIDVAYHVVSGCDHNFSTVPAVGFLRTTIPEWTTRHLS